jgi:hypothetical protein
MNPFRWTREHQLAGVAACLIGAMAGLFFLDGIAGPKAIVELCIGRVGRLHERLSDVATVRTLLAVAIAGGCHRSVSGLRRTATQNLTSGSGNAGGGRVSKGRGN